MDDSVSKAREAKKAEAPKSKLLGSIFGCDPKVLAKYLPDPENMEKMSTNITKIKTDISSNTQDSKKIVKSMDTLVKMLVLGK